MAWAPLAIRAPGGDASAILAGIPAALGLIQVDPWQYGVGEGSGAYRYLSFPNAVRAAVQRLPADYGGAVLAIGVAAASLPDLSRGLGDLAAGFPLPMFGKAARRVASLINLETDKWNLPAPLPPGLGTVLTGGLPSLAAIKRAALMQASQAAADALGDPLAALDELAAAKDEFLAQVGDALAGATAGLSGEPAGCWRCYAEADYAAALRAGVPGHEHTLSTVSVFLGRPGELAVLAGILDAVA
ncbi:hypothetical protein SAMN02949497_1756 [Methylomagnum ishizawai]|uniref:Uncharacterized protein n=1 Tax=Methylomagnum ishizawai TaxID=1760988 RepID=A0A1Y6CVM2_9GAMM|nr:hypothetical protein [Methylomagnum ishizawai]SMF94441.1 hypothetical protein SAMN02949497_1756 [Methylomagnum ishizawai]